MRTYALQNTLIAAVPEYGANAENAHRKALNTRDAREAAENYIRSLALDAPLTMGMAAYSKRRNSYYVPLKSPCGMTVGEAVIDCATGSIDAARTTSRQMLEARLNACNDTDPETQAREDAPHISPLANTVARGDCEELLKTLPEGSADLVFTSPPYFNARPEYAGYADYKTYLQKMRRVIRGCARVLNEGRFFAVNVSPVLIRRNSRSESSKRFAVPFDLHGLFIAEGFEFIDDIIWIKPEGAGWSSGRGRRFAADRNPLQYKAVPVTEYILVYRKKTERLIDWNIRKHPRQDLVAASKIEDGYEKTNVWHVSPGRSSVHPAVFPVELAEKVIRYYSFRNDVVLDPFAGTCTTALAAIRLGRRFAMLEKEEKYISLFRETLAREGARCEIDINWANTAAPPEQLSLI